MIQFGLRFYEDIMDPHADTVEGQHLPTGAPCPSQLVQKPQPPEPADIFIRKRWPPALTGLLWGSVIGGGAIFALVYTASDRTAFEEGLLPALVGAILGGLTGGVLGALDEAVWNRYRLRAPSIARLAAGFTIGASVGIGWVILTLIRDEMSRRSQGLEPGCGMGGALLIIYGTPVAATACGALGLIITSIIPRRHWPSFHFRPESTIRTPRA
ncbi:MAG: hypothetical protein HY706_15500 [Candidatus Hydrogenedentes bacterium]|nr:hypothetical protein [Candidatus Hydrogenedentota bacterium]